jgi:hypothetical protein
LHSLQLGSWQPRQSISSLIESNIRGSGSVSLATISTDGFGNTHRRVRWFLNRFHVLCFSSYLLSFEKRSTVIMFQVLSLFNQKGIHREK